MHLAYIQEGELTSVIMNKASEPIRTVWFEYMMMPAVSKIYFFIAEFGELLGRSAVFFGLYLSSRQVCLSLTNYVKDLS